jgi:hypothetical protein
MFRKQHSATPEQRHGRVPVAVRVRILMLLLLLLVVTALAFAIAKLAITPPPASTHITFRIKPPSIVHTTTSPLTPLVIQPNHEQVITTMFWVGEPGDADNDYIANNQSAWDGQWEQDYGGVDSPTNRDGYLPAGFTPHENPFYFALPYDDLDANGYRKASANLCPQSATKQNQPYSWCKNSWIAITYNGKLSYAQWEDVGPYNTDDTAYVFGATAPENQDGAHAGLDVSPAVSTYLGLSGLNKTSWAFVAPSQVPSGPWSQVVTADPGETITTN